METLTNPDGGGISKRFAEKVKAVARIVDVVGDVVELTRKGKDFDGLCPFHPDTKKGNFKVNEKLNVCTCFACGLTLSPVNFVMQYYGIPYPDAIRKLASRYNIYNPRDVRGVSYRPTWQTANPKPQTRAKAKGKPYNFKEGATFLETVGETELELREIEGTPVVYFAVPFERVRNPLFFYICKQLHTGEMVQRFHDTCKLYQVDTSDGKKYKGTKGWTIYPNIDEAGQYLTAKYMRYLFDGHRDKTAKYNFDYLHRMEQRAGRLSESANICFCLFGLHLLPQFPRAELCIVESEKTALIAQTFCDPNKKLFMATGGKSRLTFDTLEPLARAGRNIVLYPDVDGIPAWTDFCAKYSNHLARCGYHAKIIMAKQAQALYDPAKDSPTSDIADLLLRHWRERLTPPAAQGDGET